VSCMPVQAKILARFLDGIMTRDSDCDRPVKTCIAIKVQFTASLIQIHTLLCYGYGFGFGRSRAWLGLVKERNYLLCCEIMSMTVQYNSKLLFAF
jgi:hypothetical protein